VTSNIDELSEAVAGLWKTTNPPLLLEAAEALRTWPRFAEIATALRNKAAKEAIACGRLADAIEACHDEIESDRDTLQRRANGV
jgi:hypothetical protein